MNNTIELFGKLPQYILWDIATHLDLKTLQNLIDVIMSNNYLMTTLMIIVEEKMQEVRKKCRLLLWIPTHFSRHLNLLSNSSLAHVALLNTVFGDAERDSIFKYMKHTFTEIELPALDYIIHVFNDTSPKIKEVLFKEILDECTFRHYLTHIA